MDLVWKPEAEAEAEGMGTDGVKAPEVAGAGASSQMPAEEPQQPETSASGEASDNTATAEASDTKKEPTRAELYEAALAGGIDADTGGRINQWAVGAAKDRILGALSPAVLDLEIKAISEATKTTKDSLRRTVEETVELMKRDLAKIKPTPKAGDNIKSMIASAPVSADAKLPAGYRLQEGKLYRLGEESESLACQSLLVIEKVYSEVETGQTRWTVAWVDVGGWRRVTAGREVFCSKNKIVELAALRLPVTTSNAHLLVDYLASYEHTNRTAVEVKDCVGRNGWFGGRFVVGEQCLAVDGAQPVETLTDSMGEAQLMAALKPAGDPEKWNQIAGEVTTTYPRAATMLYASFATPLLKIVGAPNFLTHLMGDSSCGKTSTIEVSGSVWGDPKPNGGWIQSWNMTPVALERTAALGTDLPLMIDEAQVADPKKLPGMVYSLTQGSGKGRGSKVGMQQTAKWRTIAISAGERAIDDASQYVGGEVRVLTVSGHPWNDNQQAEFVQRAREVVWNNYGWAGISWVRAILDNQGEWESWRTQYREAVSRWATKLGGATGARRAAFVGLLELAGVLAHRFLKLPGDPVANLATAMDSVESVSESYGERAFDAAIAFAIANQTSFRGRERVDSLFKPIPPSRYLGVWKSGEIAFLPDVLKVELEKLGFNLKACLKGWEASGKLRRDNDGKHRLANVKLGKDTARMVVLKVSGDIAGGDGDADDRATGDNGGGTVEGDAAEPSSASQPKKPVSPQIGEEEEDYPF